MKVYSTFARTPELEPHHQMLFSVIIRTLVVEVSFPCKDPVSVFYCPSRLCVCALWYACVCIYVCVYVCMCKWCAYVCIYVCVYVVCMCVYMSVLASIVFHIYIYIYIYGGVVYSQTITYIDTKLFSKVNVVK